MNVASVRLDNALALFDEFVRNTIKHPDAATLRGLERRFAERLQIQPSYWSQIKSRSRQIGERLARQFEQCCHKPVGWMDVPHPAEGGTTPGSAAGAAPGPSGTPVTARPPDSPLPQDDDERFIIGLVLTYYRRHPQRARTRLLDLLGEVLVPAPEPAHMPRGDNASPTVDRSARPPATAPGTRPARAGGSTRTPEESHALWLQAQSGTAPLKKKR
ncbi:MAG TPA: hypothetical protein VH328_04815 [Burkholderiaceae bacterium]|jgi:hypothetical protein|nr:hypothetical protein [Burkholderiaceae bacterium]